MTLPNRLSLASKFFVPLSTSAYVDIPNQDGGPFFLESLVSSSGWRNMSHTPSNAGKINPFVTNQLLRQCLLVVFCVLSLLGLTAINFVQAANECDSFLSCCDTGGNCRQFYLGGIIGADFGTLDKIPGSTTVPNQSLFTAGGTVGMRSFRENGALRIEFEGRGRDVVGFALDGGEGTNASTFAKNGWSAMANIWRDFSVIGNLDMYAGGGIGAGGYRSVASTTPTLPQFSADNRVSAFAWQAGGGLIYDVSDHMAVDLGYRFFSIGDSTANYATGTPYTTNYAASELLLTVRIYEPFRRWR
jgi:opacity protein-like surface antigen